MQDKIIIRGAREHNLKNISLELPRNKMIVFTGLSGSGKSSLAFDTIFAEGQRRYIESLSAYARQFLGQMDKPDVDEIEGLSPAISIDQKAHSANPRSTVATITEIYDYLRVLFARIGNPHCPICGNEIRRLTQEEIVNAILEYKQDLSLRAKRSNLESPRPDKIGTRDDSLIVLAPVVRGRKGEYYQLLYDLYNAGFGEVRIDGKFYHLRDQIKLARYKPHTIELVVDRVLVGWPIEGNKAMRAQIGEAVETALERAEGLVTIIFGTGEEKIFSNKFSCPNDGFSFPEIEPRLFSFNSPYGACEACHGLGTEFLFSETTCPKCNGARLRNESLYVFINKKNITDVTSMSIEDAYVFFTKLKLLPRDKEIAESVLKEIVGRLKFMLDVGLNYLTLNRHAGTLSGGEAQRIRLASQIGSRLVGTLYILDEPTIGLHQRDNEKLVKTLEDLRDLGNTIIVVEHDTDTILASDYLVDIGPGAGKHGGKIIIAGPTAELLRAPSPKPSPSRGEVVSIVSPPLTGGAKGRVAASLTLQYLRGEKEIATPSHRRKIGKEFLKIRGASANNLKNIDVDIPLRRFVCVTGVSGSGKSTLTEEVMYRALSNRLNGANSLVGKHKSILGIEWLDKAIQIDQSPIGRTPRSNPATYTGVWTPIRDLFATVPESRARGYKQSRFSFNVSARPEDRRGGGRCENCEGNGTIAIEMHFLPTVYVTCDVCKGKRFDRETLEIKYKNKNIHEILAMTIEDAAKFFRDIPVVYDKLKVLEEVGLGYLELGQAATTLSGGEAQRVKLASELSRRDTGRTLYLLDEPTVGLHYEDIKKLLEVLHRLVDRGNSVVVIEHNLDIIKTADWIIDLGPEGGDGGGEVIATGAPEEIVHKSKSYTGFYLRKIL